MVRQIRSRWQRWVNRRVPRSDTQSFTQKNIFILPSGAGVVFGILLLVMLITGINYQNSLIYLTTFLLGALFVGAMHQTHRNLAGLELTLIHAGEGVAGDDIVFRFRATAASDAAAIRLSTQSRRHAPVHIPAGQSVDITLSIPSGQRGYLQLDRVRVETRFPFGLLKAWSWIRPATAGLVYPKPLAAPDVAGQAEEGEDSASQQPVAGQDHADLRPWREGDLSQRVMWKRYARTGQLVVADWHGYQSDPQWLDYDAFPGVEGELRLSYLAWLVFDRDRAGSPFGLRLPGQQIEPDAGGSHVKRCLRALAMWGKTPPRDEQPASFGTRSRDRRSVRAGARAQV